MTEKTDAQQAAEFRSILAEWDIPAIQSIKTIHKRHAVFQVISDGQTYTLKDISHGADVLRLEFTREVLTHVSSSGLRVPVPLLTRSGQCAVSFEEHFWLLTEYIEADKYPKAPELQTELFFEAGRAIARLHQALATFPEAQVKGRTWREDFSGKVPVWLSALGEGLPELQAAVVKRVEKERGAATAHALQGLHEQLIHRDCHPGNILVQGTRVVGFIDCDHICLGPRVFDLAYYAVHHLKWVTDDSVATERWLSNLPHLLNGYRSEASLTPAEVAAMPHAMMAYHVLLAHWFMGRGQMEPIALEVKALDWIETHFDAIDDVCKSA